MKNLKKQIEKELLEEIKIIKKYDESIFFIGCESGREGSATITKTGKIKKNSSRLY